MHVNAKPWCKQPILFPNSLDCSKGLLTTFLVCSHDCGVHVYRAFGNGVASNIMLSVERPHWLVAVANLLVVIHVFGSYQVCSALPAWMASIGDAIAEMHNAQLCSTDVM